MAILCQIVVVYTYAIFARIILSWFPVSGQGVFASVYQFLVTITEPLLGPIRRVLPPIGIGGMGLDLSPIIAVLLLQLVVVRILC
ncbi:MAG: YggT family protein [Acidimicrobiales bacterium]|nr:YggT family protein [Acidimicrobiales bacterium]